MTYSLCMIVKDEEAVLDRCLSLVADLFDEVVIVDTGSHDGTKEIAARYTEYIYDFTWVDDFAAARNFAFSKCTGDYIYSCDADEVLDEENRRRLQMLMEAMLPEIEIVQMLYKEDATTVLNAKQEYRAKMFKRLRPFVWQDPVHETVRLEPVVYDSDVVILHKPLGVHEKRDFAIFQKAFADGKRFTPMLYHMYAAELYKCGSAEDFDRAMPVFADRLQMELTPDAYSESLSVLAHACRVCGATEQFFDYVLPVVATGGCSEICYELGQYYLTKGAYDNALTWLESALMRTSPVVDVRTAGDKAYLAIADCFERMGNKDEACAYRKKAAEWTLPEGDDA